MNLEKERDLPNAQSTENSNTTYVHSPIIDGQSQPSSPILRDGEEGGTLMSPPPRGEEELVVTLVSSPPSGEGELVRPLATCSARGPSPSGEGVSRL